MRSRSGTRCRRRDAPYALRPAGLAALDLVRIEAGLILLEVDYTSVHVTRSRRNRRTRRSRSDSGGSWTSTSRPSSGGAALVDGSARRRPGATTRRARPRLGRHRAPERAARPVTRHVVGVSRAQVPVFAGLPPGRPDHEQRVEPDAEAVDRARIRGSRARGAGSAPAGRVDRRGRPRDRPGPRRADLPFLDLPRRANSRGGRPSAGLRRRAGRGRGSTPNTSRMSVGRQHVPAGGRRRRVDRDPARARAERSARPASGRGGRRRIVVPSRSLRSTSSSIVSTWWRRSRWTVGSSRSISGAACATATAEQDELALAERQLASVASEQMAEADPLDRRARRRPGRPGAARGSGPRGAAGRAPRPPRRASRTAGSPPEPPRCSRAIAPRGTAPRAAGPRAAMRAAAHAARAPPAPAAGSTCRRRSGRRARPARPRPIAKRDRRAGRRGRDSADVDRVERTTRGPSGTATTRRRGHSS